MRVGYDRPMPFWADAFVTVVLPRHVYAPFMGARSREAPANLKACETIAEHCTQYHADDAEYYDQLHYWTTPTKECLDGRTDVECKDYSEWVSAWTEIVLPNS